MATKATSLPAFQAARTVNEEEADALWAEYVEAARRAQASLHYEDGMAAGRAWGRFVDSFARLP